MASPAKKESIYIEFSENHVLPMLFGKQDKHIQKLEALLGVEIASRGNMVSIEGDIQAVARSKEVITALYDQIQARETVTEGEVDVFIRQLCGETVEITPKKPANEAKASWQDVCIQTQKKSIRPYSETQARYMQSLMSKPLTFASGPAGTGKTYLAVAAAVSMFLNKEVERILLCRPAVEAGESLGYLPGDIQDKIDPYLRPLYDALHEMMPAEKVVKHLRTEEIEIAPLAFMRGRTLRDSFIILDEAQNATPTQMKMFLTRIGEGSHMAVSGDLSQVDLPKHVKSGFRDAIEKLSHIDDIAVHTLKDKDVVRHPLTFKIVQAYRQGQENE